jgi:hypothetical protein
MKAKDNEQSIVNGARQKKTRVAGSVVGVLKHDMLLGKNE